MGPLGNNMGPLAKKTAKVSRLKGSVFGCFLIKQFWDQVTKVQESLIVMYHGEQYHKIEAAFLHLLNFRQGSTKKVRWCLESCELTFFQGEIMKLFLLC